MTDYPFPDVEALEAWNALIRREQEETDAARARVSAALARFKAKHSPLPLEGPGAAS